MADPKIEEALAPLRADVKSQVMYILLYKFYMTRTVHVYE